MGETVVLNVLDDVSDRAGTESWVEAGDGAKGACERAAAGGLDNAGHEKPALEKVVSGRRDSFERLWRRGITAAETAARGVFDELGPDRLGFADNDAVEVLEGLFRIEGDVRPAGDDEFAPSAKSARQAIGFGSKSSEEREGDQVGWRIEVDWFDLLVDHPDIDVRRGKRSEVDAGDGRDEVGFVAAEVAGHVDDKDEDGEGAGRLGGAAHRVYFILQSTFCQ